MGNTGYKQPKSDETKEDRLIKEIKKQQKTHERVANAKRPESVILAYLDC